MCNDLHLEKKKQVWNQRPQIQSKSLALIWIIDSLFESMTYYKTIHVSLMNNFKLS